MDTCRGVIPGAWPTSVGGVWLRRASHSGKSNPHDDDDEDDDDDGTVVAPGGAPDEDKSDPRDGLKKKGEKDTFTSRI
ncbi:hypothetical protein ZHAS_00002125 [Anopheles sinensis]|uniref:Uncharacterized protein n=1 Tax=Anopheles sinensis TaxID=74873 RepID=A0A084VBT7_ANOSI|nr:hypothetical protein ZHAS_00002125 [Anopheles sinensis]